MASFPRPFLATFGEKRSREFVIVFAILGMLVLSQGVRYFRAGYIEREWKQIQEEKAQDGIAIALQEFGTLQRSSWQAALDVGQQQAVLDFVRGMRNDRRSLFDAVARAADAHDSGIEVYDTEGQLAAWAGASGPAVRPEVQAALGGQMASGVVRTPVASQLVVALPLKDDGRIVGAVVVRKTVELDYPLSNTFIASAGLAARLGTRLGTTVAFDFSADSTGRKDGRWLAAPLPGMDGRRVGTVSVLRPARSAVIEQLLVGFAAVDTVLLVLLCIAGLPPALRWLLQRRERVHGSVGLILVFWTVRYFLLWVDFPGRLISSGIFDPSSFASGFGGGLARSVGDMFLTTITLAGSLWALGPITRPRFRSETEQAPPGVFLLRTGLAIVATFFLFWVLRGLGAVVRSAFYDSTLSYGDPGIILPPPAMSVMIFALGTLCLCMCVVGVRLTGHLYGMLGGGRTGLVRVCILYSSAAILFGPFQDEPLMSTPYRLACATLFVAGMLWQHAYGSGRASPRRGAVITGYVCASLVLLLPLLQRNIGEHARSRVEAFAVEFLRPVDGWLKIVVEDGLRQLTEASLVGVDGRPSRKVTPADVPLAAWARSTACREGYSALFAILDSSGGETGRFSIGSQAGLVGQFAEALPLDSTGMTRIKSIGDGISAVRVYGGTALLRHRSGHPSGYVRVVIAAGEQQLFRGDNPAVLRRTAGDPIESFYRPITLSEYRDGLLVRTTNAAIPYTQVLADEIRAILNRPESPMVWSSETLRDASFESYAIRRGPDSRDVIVLSLERQPFLLAMVGLVKVPVVYLLVATLGLGVLALVAWGRGRRYIFTFRDKLLAAMLLTAFVPLGALLLYGQYAVHHRVMDTLSRRLEEETAAIAQEIAGIGEYSDASSDFTLRPDRVELIASNIGTDFNVYIGNDLRVSSRPELYTTGLLDSRLNGRAYAAVVLGGRRFQMESEHVGSYQYEVGYRPVLDAAGGVIGIVGVPTLYRQDEVDRELSERNAVLIGVYAVVFLAIVIATMVFANRIAAPVQKLTVLTRDVAQGDLEIASRLPKAEGEIGELVQAFGTMASALRRSRDELVRVERDLAWREMARQIAHEIKNPLTPIKLSVQHLRQTYRDKAPDFDSILETVTRTVIEQIDALSRIASEFSNFARMPRRRVESCDVEAVVREAVQLFRQDARVAFRIDADADVPVLQADRDELRRAFINIIRNGVQAMNGSGNIDVTVRRDDGGVNVSFRDYGTGIPEEVRPRLFQPNFSTKTDGMGLGLAIVKKTMDDLHAAIEIVSAPNEGTTVVLSIPFGEDAGAA